MMKENKMFLLVEKNFHRVTSLSKDLEKHVDSNKVSPSFRAGRESGFSTDLDLIWYAIPFLPFVWSWELTSTNLHVSSFAGHSESDSQATERLKSSCWQSALRSTEGLSV